MIYVGGKVVQEGVEDAGLLFDQTWEVVILQFWPREQVVVTGGPVWVETEMEEFDFGS